MSFLSTVLKSRSGVAPAPPPIALPRLGAPFAVASIIDGDGCSVQADPSRLTIGSGDVMTMQFILRPVHPAIVDTATVTICGWRRAVPIFRCSISPGDSLILTYRMPD